MPAPIDDTLYNRFRQLILTRTGLDFPPNRRNDFVSWLNRAVDMINDAVRYKRSALNAPLPESLDDLYRLLLGEQPLAWSIVIDALTVCETHFFRNTPQFEALRDHVLPELINERRKAGNLSLNIWSAGCSTGEEAYSLAILIREILPDWAKWRLSITGTDINQKTLDQARQAVYHDWSFRERDARQARDTYFNQTGNAFQLRDDVRQMVQFEECSLTMDCAAIKQMDLILCRNVILYFGQQVRGWVYQNLLNAMAPKGWLLVGHADPPPPNFAAFKAETLQGVTLYRSNQEEKSAAKPARKKTKKTTYTPPKESAPFIPDWTPPPMESGRSDAAAHHRLGRWHADRQHWDEALHHCQETTRFDPTYPDAYYTLALIHQSMGNIDESMEALRQAIYLKRNWALPRFMLANIFRDMERIDEARRELRNVMVITASLPADTSIKCGDGLTAARLHDAAERQMFSLPPSSELPAN